MRAKTVNEIQHFEKGLSRGTLDIGGIKFQNEFSEEFNDLFGKYSKRLHNLKGKNITCEVIIGHEPVKKTFRVSKVLETGIKAVSVTLLQYVEAENGDIYQLDLASKIYIEQ